MRVFILLFFLISSSVMAEDILLDLSAPVKGNKRILVATYIRNQPDWYYFTIVYTFSPKFVNYSTKISFSLEHASQTHFKLESWIAKAMAGSKVVISNDLEICPIDPCVLPKFIEYKPEDNMRFECSSQ